MLISINYFLLNKNATLKESFLLGTLMYAMFDMINYAVFKDYP